MKKEPSLCHALSRRKNRMRKKHFTGFCTVILAGTLLAGSVNADPVKEDEFVFQPKIVSQYQNEIYGEDMVQTWYHLVDAVLAGNDTFACPDQETYDWVFGQFPDRYFPVLTQLIEPIYGGAVENGIGRFHYKTTREECESKLTEFETLVEEILQQTMKTDYSDMEKALSLYRFFYLHYEYDYETFQKMARHEVDSDVSSYDFLKEGIGICRQAACAYSYLLMQAGMDATIMMGEPRDGEENHEWSYVRINGNHYHVDPTYVLSEPGNLEYFLMTDEKRADQFPPERWVIAGTYTQEHVHPEYTADDDSFRTLWDTSLDDFDHDAHMIYSWYYDDAGNPVQAAFPY